MRQKASVGGPGKPTVALWFTGEGTKRWGNRDSPEEALTASARAEAKFKAISRKSHHRAAKRNGVFPYQELVQEGFRGMARALLIVQIF